MIFLEDLLYHTMLQNMVDSWSAKLYGLSYQWTIYSDIQFSTFLMDSMIWKEQEGNSYFSNSKLNLLFWILKVCISEFYLQLE